MFTFLEINRAYTTISRNSLLIVKMYIVRTTLSGKSNNNTTTYYIFYTYDTSCKEIFNRSISVTLLIFKKYFSLYGHTYILLYYHPN